MQHMDIFLVSIQYH